MKDEGRKAYGIRHTADGRAEVGDLKPEGKEEGAGGKRKAETGNRRGR
jgi:hypothetical protein